jgi:cyclic dehypoxanthinyl futalosine synthase
MGISRKEALDCLRSNDLIGIGMEADAVRLRLHPEGVVGYAIEAAIDCATVMGSSTREGNQAVVGCAPRLFDAIDETIELGSTGVRLVGWADGIGSESKVCGIEGMLRGIRQRFPTLWIEGLSASEIATLATGRGLTLRETIARLRGAGLNSIASDDAQAQCGAEEWLAVHRAAHGLGMSTVATMHFGAGQALELRVDLLAAVRQLQQETGGFTAFIPRGLPSRNASSGGWDGPTAVEQLKTLAVARVFLDNIENIQLNGAAQGLKVLQMGLRFGANDAGSVTPLANGTKSANSANTGGGENAAAVANRVSEEDLRRIIRDAGFQPVQRDTPYRTMFLN